MDCPFCRQGTLKLTELQLPSVFSDGKPGPYLENVLRCGYCLSYTKKWDKDWIELTNGNYTDNYQSSSSASSKNRDTAHGRRIAHIIDSISNDNSSSKVLSILDYGMGAGELSMQLLNTFSHVHVYGYDPYPQHISNQALLSNRMHILDADPASSGNLKFDVVCLIQSFEHIPNPMDKLHELVDILSDAGTLFLQIPTPYLNPVDLVVFDHAFHIGSNPLDAFPISTVSQMAVRIEKSNEKEVLISLRRCDQDSTKSPRNRPYNLRNHYVSAYPSPHRTLQVFLERCQYSIQNTRSIFIFGKSYSSKWLAYCLQNDIELIDSYDVAAYPDRCRSSLVLMPLPANQAKDLSRKLGFENILFL